MTSKETHYFCIAEHHVKVTFADNKLNNMNLMMAYYPFLEDNPNEEDIAFSLYVDDDLPTIPKEERERIKVFETGNGNIIIDDIKNGGYQFIFKDLSEIECCMFQVSEDFHEVKLALTGNYDMRCFGINYAMMMGFGMATSDKQTLLIHSSLVRQGDYGYAFHAISGTGKSTQVSMWLRFLPNCELMNDDNPIIRIIDGKAYIYGSPWSGKTPCYRNTKAKLGALTRIDRDSRNWVEKLSPIEAFTSILASVSSLKWDVKEYRNICDTVTKVVECTNAYILHCLPNKEAAEVCNEAIAIKD